MKKLLMNVAAVAVFLGAGLWLGPHLRNLHASIFPEPAYLEGDHTALYQEVAERLRQSIYDSHFVTDEGMRIPLRVSVGVAQHKAVEESLTELMVRADHALYRAKREGRNKVVESD